MKTIQLGLSGLSVPTMAVGCMRLGEKSEKDAAHYLNLAIENGANFFDHADCYGNGMCETLFAKALKMTPSVREKLILQSKCGIVKNGYDSSKEHLIEATENILRRLQTDYLDVLLIHRPDALAEPEEISEAFVKLHEQGKVRHFGVSNHNPRQMALLQKALPFPLVANQLQLSITNCTMISSGINVNMENDAAVNRDGSVLDYCRLNDITIQPWSPFQYGFFDGCFIGSPRYPMLNAKLEELASSHDVSVTTIVMAWLLRHPAKLMPIVGTMNEQRLLDCIQAADLTLSRQEWYAVYLAAGNKIP